VHEEVFRGTLSEALDRFSEPRGEFTLVIAGAPPAVGHATSEAEIDRRLRALARRGARAREAVRAVAEATGASRQAVYRRWLAVARGGRSLSPGQGP
jgi:16S rRNA (cytidine1402-2'-O)-methyltransferase